MDLKFNYYHITALLAVFVAIMYSFPIIFYIFLFTFYTLFIITCAVLGTFYYQYYKTKKPDAILDKPIQTNILYHATKNRILESPKKGQNQVIFGRTIDSLISQIIENSLKDFVFPWMSKIVNDPKNLIDNLRDDIWSALNKLVDRAQKIDAPKIIAVDAVNKIIKHLQKIRTIQTKLQETGEVVEFTTYSYLSSDEKELEFLKKFSEIFIIMLLPRNYSCSPLRDLLCEIIAYKVFYNAIKTITNPDFINQKIVTEIEAKLAEAALNRRSYEYASTFQDFLKIINNSTSMDELLMMRTSIINDLVQATTTQNLQRAKGINIDSGNTSELKRSEISAALKLKRYIQQLSLAKKQCEKNLVKLGWNGGGDLSNDLNLSLLDILSTVVGRRYFTLFLDSLNASNLIGYYTTVEELKNAPKSNVHQLGAEIFYTYIRAPNSEIKLDKKDKKQMETFLMGDNSPEIFYDVQKQIFQLLEEKYYHPFLMSDEYNQLKNAISSEDIKDVPLNSFKTSTDSNSEDQTDNMNEEMEDFSLDLANHSTYARNKLEQLQEKLKNKNQAYEALKSSLKPEATVLSILEKEIEWLKNEKRELEAHLLRTSIWTDHLGKWRATVESVDVAEDKDTPQFVIVVQVDELPKEAKEDEIYDAESDNVSTGWVVLRSLTDFHELHRKIKPLCTELKSLDLPSNNSFILFFVKNDKTSLEKAKMQIQRYLNFILEDDNLNQCEALYTFLSPSSDRLKQIQPSPKKARFSLSTLFKSGSSTDSNKSESFWGFRESENEDISMFIDGAVMEDGEQQQQQQQNGTNTDSRDSKLEIDNKDSIAEPLYVLIGEIFDMGGLFKWVRKSLISFVQITYGGTINRQIRDLVNGLFDEANLHFYATTILKDVWPGGELIEISSPERTDDMKEMTAFAAKSLLIDNIPDLLSNIVGSQNAQQGAIKIFEILQNEIYNKQLVYDMLEILMVEIFPEIGKPLETNEKSTN